MTTNNGEQHSSWTAQTPRNLPSSPSPGTLGGSSENTYSPSPVGFHQPLGLRKSFQGFPRVPYIERVFCSHSDVSYIGQLFCQVKSPAINRRNSGANTSDRRQDGNPTHALGLSGTLWRTCYSYTVEQDSKRLSKQCVPTCASPCDYLGALRWQCVPAFPRARNSRSTDRIGTARMRRERSSGTGRGTMRLRGSCACVNDAPRDRIVKCRKTDRSLISEGANYGQ